MHDKPRVLLVEDSASLSVVYQEYLKNEPISLTHVDTGKGAMEVLENKTPDLLLLDLKLPDIPGEQILAWIQENDVPTDVVVITAHGSVDTAVDMMQLGAKDFLQKPFDARRLITTVNNLLERSRLRAIVDNFSATFERDHYHNFIGACLPMQAVYQTIDSAAPSKATIFITGESGTGKEVCAEAIHKQSKVKDGPFIPINCGAIPKDLMESEIFGHVKGAFTGAQSERKGAASLAHGGTLFLDEIGEMDMDLQTKLLRFIQSGVIKKVGGSKEEKVDVRFICATNRDPLEEVQAGNFREDLYYRLNVVPLHLPPLRERGDDILLLATHFLKAYAQEDNKPFERFSAEVESALLRYTWPGNVRQLQNVIRNIVVLHNDILVQHKHLPPPLDSVIEHPDVIQKTVASIVQANTQSAAVPPQTISAAVAQPSLAQPSTSQPTEIRPLAVVEREAIEQAIAFCDGNIPKAAALLDVSPSTIYRKKQAWDD